MTAHGDIVRRTQLRLWADPRHRRMRIAAIRAAFADPVYLQDHDLLTAEQKAQLLDQLRRGDTGRQVARDWMVHPNTVYRYARRAGIALRRGRRKCN